MSYWQMDDGFLSHHKTRRALRSGPEALQMWFALRTYVAINLTDGFVSDDEIDDLPGAPKDPRRWLAVLVQCGKLAADGSRGAGLVDPVSGGWMLHDYGDHGLSAEEIRRRKKEAAERQANWRNNRRKRQREGVTNCVTHNETRDETPSQRVTNAPPSHPIPSHDLDLTEDSHSKDLTGCRDEDGEAPSAQSAEPEGSVEVANPPPSSALPPETSFGALGATTESPRPPKTRLRASSCHAAFARSMVPTPDLARELFDAWRVEARKPGADFDDRRRDLFHRLVDEGVTVERVRLVVRGARLEPFAVERGLAPSLILGSADQREKFASLATNPPKPKGIKPPRQPSSGAFKEKFMAAVNAGGER